MNTASTTSTAQEIKAEKLRRAELSAGQWLSRARIAEERGNAALAEERFRKADRAIMRANALLGW